MQMDRNTTFDSLVKEWHNQLYSFAIWLCKDPSIADDLIQETFLRVWKNIDKINEIKAIKPWLFTILRRENARRFERKSVILTDIDDCDIHCDESYFLENVQEVTQVRRAISKLPIKYREPLLLQVIGGCSSQEISEILKVNTNTVLTRLFRARFQLKNDLLQMQTQKNKEATLSFTSQKYAS